MEDAAAAQEGVAFRQEHDAPVHIHLGIALGSGEVLIRVEMTVWPHALAGKEVQDAQQALIHAAEGAVT
jgi:hypothetical protein